MADRRTLVAWCFDRVAGVVVEADRGAEFQYDSSWLEDGMPPLSQSLPIGTPADPAVTAAFFGGLLPEGIPREVIARRLGVSVENDFSLLAAIGGDTAGAISLLLPGESPARATDDVEWLDDGALATLLDELPSRPMHVDADGEFRLSLAGAQDKLPVVVGSDGRIGLTSGRSPSTHIVKTPIAALEDTVVNEAFCLAVGIEVGVDTARAEPRRVGGREFLLVERYDRAAGATGFHRLHQEDFCQARGVPTASKYEAEGGPSLGDCFALLRAATAVPAVEVVKLLDVVALNFLVGNHDAHGKNFSLLYAATTNQAALAPAYDIVSTAAYVRSHNLTRKMAMRIGGEYRPEYLKPRHLDRLIDDAGLGPTAARRRLADRARRAPAAARAVRDRFAADGWDSPVLDRVVETLDRRSAALLALADRSAR